MKKKITGLHDILGKRTFKQIKKIIELKIHAAKDSLDTTNTNNNNNNNNNNNINIKDD